MSNRKVRFSPHAGRDVRLPHVFRELLISISGFQVYISICCGLLFLYGCGERKTAADLPVLGPKQPVYAADSSVIDSVEFAVPSFDFTDQQGRPFKSASLKGQVYVVHFFFTSCPSICPRMILQMNRLRAMTDVQKVTLLSITVDPRRDTPEKLSRYISNNGLDANNWLFLTDPSKEKIYELGWHGFQLAMAEDNDSPGGFIHSEKFVLVDQNGHIRGFYVGTDSEDVSRLATDIRLLLEQPPPVSE